jgi:AcrR family transcriptional regulator
LAVAVTQKEINHGRMRGDDRRAQIITVAIKLFSQRGFSGTTTKEIARAAGVSEAMVFRHFATKGELYRAIIDRVACEGGMLDLPWENNSAEQKAIEKRDDYQVFYTLAINALKHQQHDVDFMRLLLHAALEEHELAEMFFGRFVSQLYEFLSGYVKKRQREGAMRKIEPRIIVRAFVGMLVHHSLNNILWDRERRLLKVSNEKAAHEFATILLQGVLTKQK